MAKSTVDPIQQTKSKVRRWLQQEDWQVREENAPETPWLLTAQKGPMVVYIGQAPGQQDKISMEIKLKLSNVNRFALLPLPRQQEVKHNLGILLMFLGVGWSYPELTEPEEHANLWRHIYYDGLTRDLFMERFSQICNAGALVMTSVSRALEQVKSQEEFN